tara:strand:+ start:88 stop:363 length:276 start_codon:yes stop_codon:yes gene_type:complete
MGLTITSMSVLNGLTTINDIYVNIRDLKYNKEDSEYSLEFLCIYSKENKHIKTEMLSEKFTEFYTGNIWEKAYINLKSNLDNMGLTYQDVL